jgi:hypothetical protein
VIAIKVENVRNFFMAMIRHLSFGIIQRVGVGEGVPVCTPPGVKVTLSILARRMFWIFA